MRFFDKCKNMHDEKGLLLFWKKKFARNTGILSWYLSCLIILKAFGWMNMIQTESFVMYHLPSSR